MGAACYPNDVAFNVMKYQYLLGSEDDTVSGCECSVCELKEELQDLRKRVAKLEADITVGYAPSRTSWLTSSVFGTSRVKVGESLQALLDYLKLDVFAKDSQVTVKKRKKIKSAL